MAKGHSGSSETFGIPTAWSGSDTTVTLKHVRNGVEFEFNDEQARLSIAWRAYRFKRAAKLDRIPTMLYN